MTTTETCPICSGSSRHFGRQQMLMTHDADYRQCVTCGHVFVIDPHWLEQAYSTVIAALDTGIVTRNLWLADATSALLGSSLRHVNKTLDFGGGSGLLVRLMRDRGHDFRWHDAYSPNLLAGGFADRALGEYDMVTAFELVEHLIDPMATLKTLRAAAPILLLSTELLRPDARQLDDWWYYAPESGQHIGFFTHRSLSIAAERLGLQLSSNHRNLHVLAPRPVSRWLLRALRKPSRARWLAWAGHRKSLAHADARLLRQRLQAGADGDPGTGRECR